MSTNKKIVVTTPKATVSTKTSRPAAQAPVRRGELIFGKQNYLLMLVGIGLIAVGLMLMSGGAMPDPTQWDESIIYSKRRTLVAPLVIILGLVTEIVAIFWNGAATEKKADLA